MLKSILKIKLNLLSFTTCTVLAIASFVSEIVSAAQHPNLGEIANTLIVGTDFITRIVLLITLVMGVGFILFSIGLIRTHWHNPKLVPLDKPIIYCILGIILCLIPFLGYVFGGTQSTLDIERNPQLVTQHHQNTLQQYGGYLDIDAPIQHKN